MKLIWNNLPKRQQTALISGGIAVLALLVVQFVLLPFWDVKKTLCRTIELKEKILGEVTLLAEEYRTLKQRTEKVRQALARRTQDFALSFRVEKIAEETGVKPNIKYINTLKGGVSGPYEEVSVDMEMEKITLKQLTDFLYRFESPQEMIIIKKIAITKTKEMPEYLTARIHAVTFRSAEIAGR